MVRDNEQGAVKRDVGKPRMGLLPPDVLFLTAKVFTFGAAKYDAWNWTKGFDWSRLYDAAQRHLAAWWGGETHDPESGLPHLGHALCCLMMLAAHEARGLGTDDRHRILERRGRPAPPRTSSRRDAGAGGCDAPRALVCRQSGSPCAKCLGRKWTGDVTALVACDICALPPAPKTKPSAELAKPAPLRVQEA